MEVSSIGFDVRQEYIAQVSRGGLLKPSDVVYILHAYILLPCISARDVFTTYFSNLLEESNCFSSTMTTTCKDRLYNVRAANYVTEVNSNIHHASKKRNSQEAESKRTNQRKIQKLTSSK